MANNELVFNKGTLPLPH